MTPPEGRAPGRAGYRAPARPTARPGPRQRGYERRAARPAPHPSTRRRPVTGGVEKRRIGTMRVVVLLAFCALAMRLVVVQAMSGNRYSSLGSSEVTQSVQIPAARGGIYDRNGAALAVSVPRSIVVADPYLIQHPQREAAALAPVLGVAEATLDSQLSKRTGYVVLARQVDDTTATAVTKLGLQGLNLLPDQQREQPNGQLATALLGGVNGAGAGSGGVEYQYNSVLAGVAGKAVIQQTPDAVPLPGSTTTTASAIAGNSIELTVDQSLQYVTEQSLGAAITSSHAKSGVAVVMDSRTGDILAMANLVADPKTGQIGEATQNLAVTKVYEPGSVFKLVTFSAALERGIITPQQTFSVPNSLTIDGWVFHDAEQHPTEQLTATQILAQSSNIGTIKIAGLLGPSALASQIANLGFGAPTALRFPGESGGLVKSYPSQWSGSDMGSTPIGQDDAVTAQQVLDMVNSVATGGMFVQPRLVRATIAANGTIHRAATLPAHRVISSPVAAELTAMMEQVVQDGTAVSAGIPGYTVAGKTGTAQVPDSVHGGYIPGAYMATFAGFAPAQHPVLSAIVVLEQPSPIFGGVVAAPVFSQVMAYALHRYGIPTSASAPAAGTAMTSVPLTTTPPAGSGTTGTIPATAGSATGTP